jgi:dihydrolipoamide dehydrogenase
MESKTADVTIIGGGPGGYVAAIRASALGRKVVVVEKERMGGVCLNEGCIPTKALLATARAVQRTNLGSRLGVAIPGEARVDQAAAVKRARTVSSRMSKGVVHLMKTHGIEVVKGTGRLAEPGRVTVDGAAEIAAGAVILATGGRPRPLAAAPFDGERVISSTEALWLEQVPERLVVVGAGAIGMELAYYYAVAGSRVTVVEALGSILPFADPEAVKAVARACRRLRIATLAPARVEAVEAGARSVVVRGEGEAGAFELEADRLLVAIGVAPVTEGLWDPSVGVTMEGPFVGTDDVGRTNVPGVYAIGDVAGPPLLAHAASHEGVIAAEHVCGRPVRGKAAHVTPAVVYCQPQVAQVGMTEEEARRGGRPVTVGRYPFVASGMAQASSETEGFVKLVFDDPARRLLGATVVGAEAAELVSELCLAVQSGLGARDIIAAVHPHPTFAEAVMEAAAQAAGAPVHAT